MKKQLFIFLSLSLLLFTAPVLIFASELEITDITGRTVLVPKNPERIVAIGPGGLRLLSYMELNDKVVGVEGFEKANFRGRVYMYAFPRAQELPTIAPGGPQSVNTMPDTEAVLAAGAQIIYASHMQADMANRLQQRLGIPVVTISYGPRFGTIGDDFFRSLELIGQISGKAERAQAIEQYYNTVINDLDRRVSVAENSGVKKPSVYVGAVGHRGAQGISSTDASLLPLYYLRTNNVAAKYSDGHIFLDREKLLLENPEIIFIDGMGLNLVREDYSKNKRYYQSLRAFRNNQVYLLWPFNFYTTNLGTVVVSAYSAGKLLYPEQFQDVDISSKANEAYRFLLGADLYERLLKDFGDPASPLVF